MRRYRTASGIISSGVPMARNNCGQKATPNHCRYQSQYHGNPQHIVDHMVEFIVTFGTIELGDQNTASGGCPQTKGDQKIGQLSAGADRRKCVAPT